MGSNFNMELITEKMNHNDQVQFLRLILRAGAKDKEPAILRKVFPMVQLDDLHEVMRNTDRKVNLLSKSVLAWAVENNDV